MPPFDPLSATGLVQADDDAHPRFLGTGFLFRRPEVALTTAHCAGGHSPKSLRFLLPRVSESPFPVTKVETAPGADLAAMFLSISDLRPEPFWNHVSNFTLGEDVVAYGYPEDIFGPDSGAPTPRLFRGHYQRYMTFRSHLGFEYNAGELSFPAPGGLSGGPVFRPGAHPMITGLVTENLYSTTVLEAAELVEKDGVKHSTHYQRVITFGVALLLDSHEAWLRSLGITRRAT